jgi:hypothetical protein
MVVPWCLRSRLVPLALFSGGGGNGTASTLRSLWKSFQRSADGVKELIVSGCEIQEITVRNKRFGLN